MNETWRLNSQEKMQPPRKIIKEYSKKKKYRKKRSPRLDSRDDIENVLSLWHDSSAKKHHGSHSFIGSVHPRPFDLYSSFRRPTDPSPVINHGSGRTKSRRKHKKSKKRLRSRKEYHHKSGSNNCLLIHIDLMSNPRMDPKEENYLRKSKSTFMNSGWGISKRNFAKEKSSKIFAYRNW